MKKDKSVLVLFLSTMEDMEAGSGFGPSGFCEGRRQCTLGLPLCRIRNILRISARSET